MVATRECRCKCGYTCSRGGPGLPKCELDIVACVNTHFVRDCDHKFDGPVIPVNIMGCEGTSVTCSVCGLSAVCHDFRVGP